MSDLLLSLAMPLRDVVRTAYVASRAAAPVLRPAARALPPPLLHLAEEAARRADAFRHHVVDLPAPATEAVLEARAALARPAPDAAARLARVLAFALTEALARFDRADAVAVESRLALLVPEAAQGGGALLPALARLAVLTLRSHAVLDARDRPAPPGAVRHDAATREAVFAAMLWLALDREGPQDETQLLELAVDVVRHLGLADGAEPAAVEAQLRRLAAVI